MTRFVYIPGWPDKGLTCSRCGTKRSVKYEVAGCAVCNACVLGGEPKRKFTVPVEFSAISYYEVEADSADEAEEKVIAQIRSAQVLLLQENTEVPGSFEVLSDGIESEPIEQE
jgi:transcription elongation factor Elf1